MANGNGHALVGLPGAPSLSNMFNYCSLASVTAQGCRLAEPLICEIELFVVLMVERDRAPVAML